MSDETDVTGQEKVSLEEKVDILQDSIGLASSRVRELSDEVASLRYVVCFAIIVLGVVYLKKGGKP